MSYRPNPLPTPGTNLFWVLLTVFLLLAADYGSRLSRLIQQRDQLNEARVLQAQNFGRLTQSQQNSSRLEPLSLELLQMAKTNATAQKIVEDFKIKWTPPVAQAGVPASAPATPAIAPPPANLQTNR